MAEIEYNNTGIMTASAAKFRLPPLPSIKEVIRIFNLRAKKQLSQNFLLDMNLTKKIVKMAGKIEGGQVVEVGPGPGGITRALIETGISRLSVVEKDRRFLPGLELLKEASLKESMSIHHADILRFDMENIFDESLRKQWHNNPPNIHVVGNLPFNVSTPLIVQWLEQIANRQGPWTYGRVRLTLTFQKEVGERMVAEMLDSQRSRLSIMCQYLCDVRYKFTIPGKAFVPAPDVDVAVVHFIPRRRPLIDVPYKSVEKVVRHVFHYRQKMCKRGIQTLFPPDRSDLTVKMLKIADIDPSTRSFALSMEEFERLCKAYEVITEENPGILDYDYRSKYNAIQWRKTLPILEL